MRTSRVGNSTANVNRNFNRVSNNGDVLFKSNFQQGPHQHLRDESKKQKQNPKKQHKLVNQKGRLIVKGILFADETGPTIHNSLLRNAVLLNAKTNIKVRNHIYRTSI